MLKLKSRTWPVVELKQPFCAPFGIVLVRASWVDLRKIYAFNFILILNMELFIAYLPKLRSSLSKKESSMSCYAQIFHSWMIN